MRGIRENNIQRLSKLEQFEEKQRQLHNFGELRMQEDLARREAEFMNMVKSEEAVAVAKRDITRLRNVDRPLYDLLLTGVDSFKASRESQASNTALIVKNHEILGDVPRLVHNLEETSFLTADKSGIEALLI